MGKTKRQPLPLGDTAQRVRPPSYRLPPGECSYCDTYRDESMMPPHTASQNCESGKRNHCTCDVCF